MIANETSSKWYLDVREAFIKKNVTFDEVSLEIIIFDTQFREKGLLP